MAFGARGITSAVVVVLVTLAMIGAGLGTAGAASTSTVSASNVTVSPGEQGATELTIDKVPDGLKIWNLTVTISDPSVATIKNATGGDGDGVTVVSNSGNQITIQGSDLGFSVQSGATDVSLGTINLHQFSSGNAEIRVSINSLENDNSMSINPAVDNGTITVADKVTVSGAVSQPTGPPASGTVIANTGTWPPTEATGQLNSSGEYTVSVIPGASYTRTYYQAGPGENIKNPTDPDQFPDDDVPDIHSLGSLTPSSPTDVGTEVLPTGHDLNVSVVDSNGNPVNSSAGIDFYPNKSVDPLWQQSTGSDGMYQAHPNTPGIDAHGPVVIHANPIPSTYVQKTHTENVTVNSPKDVTINVQKKTTTTAQVVLQGAPNGLQQYEVSLKASNNATISSFKGGKLSLQTVGGGQGKSFVRVRAIDVGTIGQTSDDLVLLEVEFAGNVSKQTLNETVHQLTDDNGDSISSSRVSLSVAGSGSSSLFSSALPGVSGQGPPTNLDSDGKYEDINGDGQGTFDDAIALAFVQTSGLSQAQVDALDFDGDGDVDFQDAIELAFDPALL